MATENQKTATKKADNNGTNSRTLKDRTVSGNVTGLEDQFEQLRAKMNAQAPWAGNPTNSDVIRFAILTAAEAIKKGA